MDTFPFPGKRALAPWEIAARRRNALKSTGPRTAAGKRRSSLNALKRGLCPPWRAYLMVSRGEDPGEYRRLHRDLISLFQPADPFASQVLAELTEAWWEKVRRLRLGCEGPLEEAEIRRLDARIECRLMALTHALSLLSRKWYYGLTRVFGGRLSSYKTLRVRVEARLRAFRELVPPPRRNRRGNDAASRQK